ncbi:MAG: hypothetical protein WBN04_03965 [Paracoccaceae bacterium]
MIRTFALCLTALTLAACGVDGAPIRPTDDTPAATGVSVTGTAQIGIAGGN